MTYAVYIVRGWEGSLYVGLTSNLEQRLREHNDGIDTQSFTCRIRPVEVVYAAYFSEVWHAIGWERRIKRWSRKKKEALIRGEYERLPALSFSKNRQVHFQKIITRFRVMVSLSNHRHGSNMCRPSTSSG